MQYKKEKRDKVCMKLNQQLQKNGIIQKPDLLHGKILQNIIITNQEVQTHHMEMQLLKVKIGQRVFGTQHRQEMRELGNKEDLIFSSLKTATLYTSYI